MAERTQATTKPTDSLVRIERGGELLIDLRDDGTAEIGEAYTPDEAAQRFWDAVVRCMPEGVRR